MVWQKFIDVSSEHAASIFDTQNNFLSSKWQYIRYQTRRRQHQDIQLFMVLYCPLLVASVPNTRNVAILHHRQFGKRREPVTICGLEYCQLVPKHVVVAQTSTRSEQSWRTCVITLQHILNQHIEHILQLLEMNEFRTS
jgi:hypothetical protein